MLRSGDGTKLLDVAGGNVIELEENREKTGAARKGLPKPLSRSPISVGAACAKARGDTSLGSGSFEG